MFTSLTISSLFLASVPAILAQSVGTGSCTDVHIFIARGWNEDYPGRQGSLTAAVCANLPGKSCDYEDIAYDAYSTDYCPSVAAGELLALQQINAYYAKCPETAIVLSGYSEGATVLGNVLAGDSGDVFCPTRGHAGLTNTASGVACNIAAVTLFGNPRHTADQPYNTLSGSAGQANSHRDAAGLARLNAYAPRLHDYCNIDDLVCAPGLGADTVEAHTNYFQLYTNEAAQYIAGVVSNYSKDKYCAVATSSSSSSSSASSTASSSAITSGSVSSSAVTSGSASSSAVTSAKSSAVTSASSAVVTSTKASGNATVPVISSYSAPSSYSSPASVPYITATEVATIYTTVCPQTSIYSNGNMTRTSTWTGPSTVTSTVRLTTTTTVAATYIGKPSSVKQSSMTTISGSPAVVQYTSTVSLTTYANFPTLTITLAVPTATVYLNGQGKPTATKAAGTGVAASGSGAGVAKPTGSSAPITPFEGAASSSGVAAKWLLAAAGVAGLMMI